MITPIAAAELMPESPDQFTLDETLDHATKIIELCAKIGVGSAAIPVRTELVKQVVQALVSWGFVPHWRDYNTGWSSVVVNLPTLAWFADEAIATHRARRQIGAGSSR